MDKKYTYYYQFLYPGNQYSPGVYQTNYPNGLMLTLSHRIWVVGPRGGIRIIHEDFDLSSDKKFGQGYKTRDSKAMKEFAWVKLTAKQHGS